MSSKKKEKKRNVAASGVEPETPYQEFLLFHAAADYIRGQCDYGGDGMVTMTVVWLWW